MSVESLFKNIGDACAEVSRPQVFIRGTCACEECLEHESEMQAIDPVHPSLELLGNPGWDPICFASVEAYLYLLPGLVRLVLEQTDAYIQQFIFHLEQPERLDALSPAQAVALRKVLEYLLLQRSEVLDQNLVAEEVCRTLDKLPPL